MSKSVGWDRSAADALQSGSSDWSRPSLESIPPKDWEDTKLYQRWQNRVKLGKPNDFVVVVSASSHTGVSGTGKTTASTSIAEEFDLTDDGYDAEAHGTLDPSQFAYDILLNAPEGSALVLEEAQGTPASSGLNKRRGMKDESMHSINGILANRDMRYTVIIVVQQLQQLDISLIPVIDAWLLIRQEPSDRKGPLMTHHKVFAEDYQLKHKDIKTPALEDLEWPELAADNPNYAAMERKKQEAKRHDGHETSDDGDGEIYSKADVPNRIRDDIIGEMFWKGDMTQEAIAEYWDLTQPRVQQICKDWK